MDKIKVFENLLNKFETEEIKSYCTDMIKEIPDYIFTIPSSTSFKYHNKTQCQPHGQIFHILMFAEVMNYILGLEYVKEKTHERQRDCLRCTPIFHDAIKCGLNGSRYTVHEHPLLAGEWVRNTNVEHDIDTETKAYIARLCESHSGEWTSTKRSKTVLPKPENDEQFFVHMCDYLASRSNLDMIYSDEVISTLGGVDIPKEELSDLDKFIRAPYGNGLSPELNKEVKQKQLTNIKETINQKENLEQPEIQKIKDFDNNKSEVETGEKIAQVSDEEILQAIKTLKNAGLNLTVQSENQQNQYSQVAQMMQYQDPKMAELSMLLGNNNNNNSGNMMNMLPMLMSQAQKGQNIDPRVMQAMMMNSMMSDFSFNNDNNRY